MQPINISLSNIRKFNRSGSFILNSIFNPKFFNDTCNIDISDKAAENIASGKLKLNVQKRGPHPTIDSLSIFIGDVTGYIALYVGGNGNTLEVNDGVAGNFDLRLWRESRITIGEKSTSNGLRVECDKSEFIVGKDCMFSDTILAQTSDQHGIVCLKTKQIVNMARRVTKIGDHCWIGRGATLTGNISIGEGSIIGTSSVVTSDIPPFCIAAGVPARVVREEATWSRYPERLCESSQNYLDEIN